jgi:hypothetical protein
MTHDPLFSSSNVPSLCLNTLFQSPHLFVENLDYRRSFKTVRNCLNGSNQITITIKRASTELLVHISK